jgi:hypothetical protein
VHNCAKIPRSAPLETYPPAVQSTVANELCLVHETTAAGISYHTQRAGNTTWDLWIDFCWQLHQDPALADVSDPIPLLQLFGQRYWLGIIAPSGSNARSRTVEGALPAIGQAFSALGFQDPRLTPSGKLDFRLSCQLLAYKKQDPHRIE